MVTRTAALRLQLIDSASGPAKTTTTALKGLEKSFSSLGKSGTPEVRKLGKELDYLSRKSRAVGEFRELRRGLKETSREMQAAQANVQRLERAMQSAGKPTRKMEADLRTARSTLKSISAAFREQGAAVRTAENALRSFGLAGRTGIARSQQEIRSQLAQTIKKMRELDREARKSRPPRGGGARSVAAEAAVAAGGATAVHTGRRAAAQGFHDAVDYNKNKAFRDALGGSAFNPSDINNMNKQAAQIGKDTRFTNSDVVSAQLSVLQGGARDAELIMNMLGPITDYALAMGVTLEEAAATIRSASQIRNIPMRDIEGIKTFVDQLVWMAKNGGMNDADIFQYIRYGGGAMRSVGLSDPVANAMGVILRRSGYAGDEAGVFTRTAAAKLGAPTNPGRLALQAMGLNFDDYVTQPDAFKVRGINKMMQENFGLRIDKALQDKITQYLDEATVMNEDLGEEVPVGSDRGQFTAGVMDLMAPLLNGMTPKDRAAVAKKLGDFHKFSAESVDSEQLLLDILKSDPSLAQLNAFFTSRQGARANILSQRFPEFLQAIELMKNTPKGITNQIGTKANEGLYGDYTRATGAVENALIQIVEDWETPIRSVLVAVDDIATEFTNLSDTTRRLIEVVGVAVIALAGFAAWRSGMGLLGRIIGGGAASNASSVAAGSAAGGILGNLTKGSFWKKGAGVLGILGAAYSADQMKKEAMGSSSLYAPSLFDVGSLASGAMQHWFKQAQEQSSPSAGAGLSSKIQSEMQNWPIAAQQGIQGYLQALTNGGAEAEVKAQQIADETKRILSFEANPTVATASLERALDLARQLAAVLRTEKTGGGSTNVSGSTQVGGTRAAGGPVQKGKTYAVGGSGVELFTAGANGYVTPSQAGGVGSRSAGIMLQIENHFTLGGSSGDIIKQAEAAAEAVVRTILARLDHDLSLSSDTTFANLTYGDR
ncbi:phage tail tape measure protein [Pseudochrobactrum sp. Wa41.01b-1]|uniref:phage tail tape measure protein n=1 Tax=Pseudochrobactrum sp. Wa41.01b-1 TaxID=2864102 RepID=UPI001C690375|nr:phage tail tape measure protein [Pseudochrobactrum sp. Wa41.01b-1]QYM72451.1 phage tail tape measure protein [Pseudochrobactrum sp. Wa41.01b-1]